jgi:surface polysaccharide O-acyltransferase-like enzyme
VFYTDFIRALAIIAIVFLHVFSPIAQDFSGYPLGWWWIANIVYSCARPAIALFVMISGLLLLSPGKEESISTFFKKRFTGDLYDKFAFTMITLNFNHSLILTM